MPLIDDISYIIIINLNKVCSGNDWSKDDDNDNEEDSDGEMSSINPSL